MLVLKFLSSLRLTVALMAMAMVLILAGTLAQVEQGVWTVVGRYFRSVAVVIEPNLFIPEKWVKIPGGIPFPGGLTLGVLLFINLVAAHAATFKLSWKRAGMIVTHLGVLLLLVGEFVTGALAEEGNMSIDEGASANYVEDIRTSELAVIDRSGAAEDAVVAVSQRLLAHGGRIAHAAMPFEVEVVQWMPNSQILGPKQSTAAQRGRADQGFGTMVAAVEVPRAAGVDGATVDIPSAYVRLTKAGRPLGSYLVSVHFSEPQEVVVDGKAYDVELRFKRTYKPYTIHLIDFRHEKFVGTDKPRNFSSLVRVQDPSRGVDRQVLIYMNHPLRYHGETFYQSAFKQGDVGTVLQVVRNPGWLLPYISCGMVTAGLLWHFLLRLAGAMRRAA